MNSIEHAKSQVDFLYLEEAISSTGQSGRGMGLFYLSKLVSDTDSKCLIASNSGFVFKQNNIYTEKNSVLILSRMSSF